MPCRQGMALGMVFYYYPMKRQLIVMALAILSSFTASAQDWQMVIHRNVLSPRRSNFETRDRVAFEPSQAEQHDYADLGLSVMWATCNVGADMPEDYGYYFAWGETETKETYTEQNYSLKVNGVYDTSMTEISGTQYDAATMMWQDTWRMPTIEEVEELATHCTWTWTSVNGINGYRITGPSGQHIFLPAAGQMREQAVNVGSTGYYWTGTLSAEYTTAAYNLNFTGYSGRWSANRAYGFCIRPVCDR